MCCIRKARVALAFWPTAAPARLKLDAVDCISEPVGIAPAAASSDPAPPGSLPRLTSCSAEPAPESPAAGPVVEPGRAPRFMSCRSSPEPIPTPALASALLVAPLMITVAAWTCICAVVISLSATEPVSATCFLAISASALVEPCACPNRPPSMPPKFGLICFHRSSKAVENSFLPNSARRTAGRRPSCRSAPPRWRSTGPSRSCRSGRRAPSACSECPRPAGCAPTGPPWPPCRGRCPAS